MKFVVTDDDINAFIEQYSLVCCYYKDELIRISIQHSPYHYCSQKWGETFEVMVFGQLRESRPLFTGLGITPEYIDDYDNTDLTPEYMDDYNDACFYDLPSEKLIKLIASYGGRDRGHGQNTVRVLRQAYSSLLQGVAAVRTEQRGFGVHLQGHLQAHHGDVHRSRHRHQKHRPIEHF